MYVEIMISLLWVCISSISLRIPEKSTCMEFEAYMRLLIQQRSFHHHDCNFIFSFFLDVCNRAENKTATAMKHELTERHLRVSECLLTLRILDLDILAR